MSDSEVFSQFLPISDLDGQFLSEVVRQTRVITVPKGTMLFKRGKALCDHYYLLEGEVDLINNEFGVERVKSGTDRSQRVLNTQSPTVVSAVAKTHVRYCIVNCDVLARQLALAKAPPPVAAGAEIETSTTGGEPGIEVGDLSDSKDWMTCLLQSHLFARIPWSQLQELFNKFETLPVSAGEKVIREGARGDYFYVLASGTALVTNRSGSVDIELSEGSYFGEEALISDAPRNATVTMNSAGVVKRLCAKDFASLVRQSVIQYLELRKLEALKKPYKLIDVRMPLEYRVAHLPESLNMPLSRLRDNLGDLGQGSLYAISDEAGPRAEIAAYILCQAGFDAVVLKNAAAAQLSAVS
jgi:CRP-like cAMP-binding protein